MLLVIWRTDLLAGMLYVTAICILNIGQGHVRINKLTLELGSMLY